MLTIVASFTALLQESSAGFSLGIYFFSMSLIVLFSLFCYFLLQVFRKDHLNDQVVCRSRPEVLLQEGIINSLSEYYEPANLNRNHFAVRIGSWKDDFELCQSQLLIMLGSNFAIYSVYGFLPLVAYSSSSVFWIDFCAFCGCFIGRSGTYLFKKFNLKIILILQLTTYSMLVALALSNGDTQTLYVLAFVPAFLTYFFNGYIVTRIFQDITENGQHCSVGRVTSWAGVMHQFGAIGGSTVSLIATMFMK